MDYFCIKSFSTGKSRHPKELCYACTAYQIGVRVTGLKLGPGFSQRLNYLIVSNFEVHSKVEIMELPPSQCKSIFPEGQRVFAAFSICCVAWVLPNMNCLSEQKCEKILS